MTETKGLGKRCNFCENEAYFKTFAGLTLCPEHYREQNRVILEKSEHE